MVLSLAAAALVFACVDPVEPPASLETSLPSPSYSFAPGWVVDGYLRDPVTGVVDWASFGSGFYYMLDSQTGDHVGYLNRTSRDGSWVYYFELSPDISDNSYGANAIGWDRQGHDLDDLVRGSQLRMEYTDCSGATALDATLDYLDWDRSTGQVLPASLQRVWKGDPAGILAWASSMQWNQFNASPSYPAKAETSPPRIPTNGYGPGTSADPANPWIYEVGYEWSVSQSVFGGPFCNPDLALTVTERPRRQGHRAGGPITPVPFVRLAMSATPSTGTEVGADETIQYAVHFFNEANAYLNDVTVTVPVDDDLSDVVVLDGDGVVTDGVITWRIRPLFPGAGGFNLHYNAKVAPRVDGAVIHAGATVSALELPVPARTNVVEHRLRDTDGDGVSDAFDNCPLVANLLQADGDGDGFGEACDRFPDDPGAH